MPVLPPAQSRVVATVIVRVLERFFRMRMNISGIYKIWVLLSVEAGGRTPPKEVFTEKRRHRVLGLVLVHWCLAG